MTLIERATAVRSSRRKITRPTLILPSQFRAVRSGKGLGDSLYLQSIVRHMVEHGAKDLEVCTSWPDVFRPIRDKVKLSPFRRHRVNQSYHYISRKRFGETDQFVDCCISAGLTNVDLRLDWRPRNKPLVDRLQQSGKPIVMVQLPREPMGRADGFGLDLLPNCETIQKVIDLLGDRVLTVQVGGNGREKPLYRLKVAIDLANGTSVSDLLDVASICSGAVGYCSFIAPLAESLRKPLLLVWSQRGFSSTNSFIRVITPHKIIHRPETSRAVMDDCPNHELADAVNAFYIQAGGCCQI